MRWFVDASNVIGSRPDGWWRDREGATKRLLDAARAYAQRTGDDLVVVLDAGPRELAGEESGMTVALAPRPGRDADHVVPGGAGRVRLRPGGRAGADRRDPARAGSRPAQVSPRDLDAAGPRACRVRVSGPGPRAFLRRR